mmetsp:Transcript_78144/g.219209  ORF Transcript_78144/g.219209 Transcript_78144/m.219209 type:complete len:309 (-) Transcript_78144:231-1157(-)
MPASGAAARRPALREGGGLQRLAGAPRQRRGGAGEAHGGRRRGGVDLQHVASTARLAPIGADALGDLQRDPANQGRDHGEGLAGDLARGIVPREAIVLAQRKLRAARRRRGREDVQGQLVHGALADEVHQRPHWDDRTSPHEDRKKAQGRRVVVHDLGAFEALATRVVDPFPRRQRDAGARGLVPKHGGDQEKWARHELIHEAEGGVHTHPRLIRELEGHRAHRRHAGHVSLVGERVEVGRQPGLQAQGLAVVAGVWLAEGPRLLVDGRPATHGHGGGQKGLPLQVADVRRWRSSEDAVDIARGMRES